MSQPVRPENRRRAGVEASAWADTVPALFRSEGFAEDLFDAASFSPAGAPASTMGRLKARLRLSAGRSGSQTGRAESR